MPDQRIENPRSPAPPHSRADGERVDGPSTTDARPAAPAACDGDFLAAIAAAGRQFDGGKPAELRFRTSLSQAGSRQSSSNGRASNTATAGPIVVVCGSCQPASTQQIRTAIADGFAEVILSPNALAAGEINSAVAAAVAMVTLAIDGGRSVVLHTHCEHQVAHTPADDAHLGEALGRVLKSTLERRPVRRVVVVGGDTCRRVAEAVGVEAVEVVGALGDGLYLCRTRATAEATHGVTFVFKGGVTGAANAFACLRDTNV